MANRWPTFSNCGSSRRSAPLFQPTGRPVLGISAKKARSSGSEAQGYPPPDALGVRAYQQQSRVLSGCVAARAAHRAAAEMQHEQSVSDPAAAIRPHIVHACLSRQIVDGHAYEDPVPRLSKRRAREGSKGREKRAKLGSRQKYQDGNQPITKTRSSGASPRTL